MKPTFAAINKRELNCTFSTANHHTSSVKYKFVILDLIDHCETFMITIEKVHWRQSR